MKRPWPGSARRLGVLLALSVDVLIGHSLEASTFAARVARGAPPGLLVDSVLRSAGLDQRWCHGGHCIVLADTPSLADRLRSLERPDLLTLELIPDAHLLHFMRATYDAEADRLSGEVAGLDELPPVSTNALFAVVLKSYPDPVWLRELEALGVLPLEPVPAMGYLIWGPRTAVAFVASTMPWVRRVREIPAGLKRFRVDDLPEGDSGGAAPALVHVVDAAGQEVIDLLAGMSPVRVRRVLRAGRLSAYSARLTPAQARVLSRRPDVVYVSREPQRFGPADERSNRIVAGTFGVPGTSWPRDPLPQNAPPYYWDSYLAQLAAAGVDPSRQAIGFLDTGVDEALKRAEGKAVVDACPPHLSTPTGCRLVFTTDASSDFDIPDRKADDWRMHGTAVTAVAAGATNGTPPRDSSGYAFEQGIAPGVKVAMSKIFFTCQPEPSTPRPMVAPGVAEAVDFSDMQQLLRYSLVELTHPGDLPGRPAPPSPEVRIFNHSWNRISGSGVDARDYDTVSQLVDMTARDLSSAYFYYQRPESDDICGGAPGQGALHVLAAGNRVPPDYDMPVPTAEPEVRSPGNAKNGITVGATRTADPRLCTPDLSWVDCWGAENLMGSNPRVVAGFSRIGYPNQRLKPDLVAPGSRVYGRLTERMHFCQDICLVKHQEGSSACSHELPYAASQRLWLRGTSFATPMVSGAAAIVRDWLGASFQRPSPSTALLRAVLSSGASNLVPYRQDWGLCCSSPTDCWECGDMRPAPDSYQGWGGLSFDRLLGATNRYFLYDQGTTFTGNGQTFSKTLTITDPTKPVTLMLTWTDRHSSPVVWSAQNLVNDLDLEVTAPVEGAPARRWLGNNYRCHPDDVGSARTGYSLDTDNTLCPLLPDRKNNAEKIDIHPSRLPPGATQITLTVGSFALTGDGVSPGGTTPRQDFAIAVENAHE